MIDLQVTKLAVTYTHWPWQSVSFANSEKTEEQTRSQTTAWEPASLDSAFSTKKLDDILKFSEISFSYV